MKGRMWIGANDIEKEGTFVWTDGTQVTTTYWYPGQPYGTNSDCVRTNYKEEGGWNDAPCDEKMIFLCQKDGRLN